MTKKTKLNFLYQIIYQVLIIIVPLVTAPYISRVLGPDNIGKYSYYYSIVNYFVIFGMLGLNTYGNRSIAMVRDNQEEVNKTFSELFFIHLIISSIVLLCSFTLIAFIPGDEILLYLINILYIVASVFDINWLYYGLEDIKNIVFKNLIIKLLSTIIIFLFVKQPNDLWVYCLSLAGSQIIGTLILWLGLRKRVRIQFVNFKQIIKHLKPLLILFLPVIAINLYKYMDKLMLYWFNTSKETGFYENAEKIVTIPNSILGAVGLVMLPYCSNLAAKNRITLLKKQIQETLKIILFFSIPLAFGLAAIAFEFSILYFGSDFSECGILISLLCFTIYPLCISNIIRSQYLMPLKRDKEFNVSLFFGALFNIIFNLMLIPILNAVGAVIGTIIAEFVVCITQIIFVRKELNIIKSLLFTFPYIICGFFMFIIVRVAANYLELSLINLFLLILLGILVYSATILPLLLTIHYDWFLSILSFLKLDKFARNFRDKRTSRLTKNVNTIYCSKYHFSFDDVCDSFNEININEYSSIFDSNFFKELKLLNEKYGICFTLNISNVKIFSNLSNLILEQLKEQYTWLRISFHSYENKPLKKDEDILDYYLYFINSIKRVDSQLIMLDSHCRLEGFVGTLDQLKCIYEIDKKTKTFFSSDDERDSYEAGASDYFSIIPTSIRLDNAYTCAPKAGSYLFSSDPYQHCLLKYRSKRNEGPLVVFAHESFFYKDGKFVNDKLLERMCQFIYDYNLEVLD